MCVGGTNPDEGTLSYVSGRDLSRREESVVCVWEGLIPTRGLCRMCLGGTYLDERTLSYVSGRLIHKSVLFIRKADEERKSKCRTGM